MAFVNSTKTPSDSSLLERTSRRFLWCCSSFMSVFFMLVAVHFRATFSMPPALWALLLVLFIALLFRLQRALRVWMGVFYLTFFPHISVTTCFYQSLPRSRKLFFEVCRASCWSSKRRPHPSVCLIHSIPESWYSGEFVFKSYQILPWITCGKKFSLSAPYSFEILFACSKPYVKIIENTLKKTFTAYNRFDENAHQSYF